MSCISYRGDKLLKSRRNGRVVYTCDFEVATSARQKLHWVAATKIACVNGPYGYCLSHLSLSNFLNLFSFSITVHTVGGRSHLCIQLGWWAQFQCLIRVLCQNGSVQKIHLRCPRGFGCYNWWARITNIEFSKGFEPGSDSRSCSVSVDRQTTLSLDSDDDFRSGCRNVSHCHRQQSFSGLPSPGRSHYTIKYRVPLS